MDIGYDRGDYRIPLFDRPSKLLPKCRNIDTRGGLLKIVETRRCPSQIPKRNIKVFTTLGAMNVSNDWLVRGGLRCYCATFHV